MSKEDLTEEELMAFLGTVEIHLDAVESILKQKNSKGQQFDYTTHPKLAEIARSYEQRLDNIRKIVFKKYR